MPRNYAAQNTETSPNLPARKSPSKKINKNNKNAVSADSRATRPKIYRNSASNEKLPTQKSGEIPALHESQRKQSTNS